MSDLPLFTRKADERIAELEAQLAAERADAERYRWWVKHCWFYRGMRCLQETGTLRGEIGVKEGQTKKQAIDAAVDAAMLAAAPGAGGE